jgi:hypothetical protein
MAAVALTGAGNVTTATVNSGTSLVITKPANVADGDYFVALIHYSITAGTQSTPSGWTQQQGENTSRSYYVYTKPIPSAAAETDTDYTWNMTGGAGRLVGAITRVTGAHATTPLDANGTATTTGVGSTVAPSMTAVGTQCLLMGFYFTCDSSVTSVITAPGSMSSVVSVTVNPAATSTIMITQEQLSAAGATGTRTASNSPGASSGVGGMLMTILPDPVVIPAVARVFPSLAASQAAIW